MNLGDPHGEIFRVWAAAWIDTEGSIGIRCNRLNPRRPHILYYCVAVGVTQLVREPLDLLRSAFGGHIRFDASRGRRPIYLYIVHSRKAVELLKAIRPYLLVKGARADIAIRAGEITHPGDQGRGRNGRWHQRPPEATERLNSMKRELQALNGWSEERRLQASAAWKRRNPQPRAWAARYNACVECQRTDRRHHAHGLCQRCYNRRHWHRRHPHDYDPHKIDAKTRS